MGAVCFQLTYFFVMIEMIYKLCLIVIIKSELWTITHCLGLGHETMVCAVCLSIFLSYTVGFICIPRKLGLVSFITEQSYHVRKWSNTLWPDDGIRLFLHYITSLSLLCRRIWRYCTSKILGREILPRVFLRLRFFSIIFHAIYGPLCIRLAHLSYDVCMNTCTLSYCHQTGSMTHLPLFRVRS